MDEPESFAKRRESASPRWHAHWDAAVQPSSPTNAGPVCRDPTSRCATGRRAFLFGNVNPEIDLQSRSRYRKPGNFNGRERKRHSAHRLGPDFERCRKVPKVGMELLDAHGIFQARSGGPADRLRLRENVLQLALYRYRVEGLRWIGARLWDERPVTDSHETGNEQKVAGPDRR